MPSNRLLAIVTMLIMAAGNGARAELSIGQLQEIEALIVSKDCNALFSHLESNPQLLEGSDPLANELRVFHDSAQRGYLDCFGAPASRAAQDITGAVY